MAEDAHLLTDLALQVRHHLFRPVHDVVAVRGRGAGGGRVEDLDTVTGRSNLGQALLMRLLTPVGELTSLGHPAYGSRVPELIGRANTATTRDLLTLAILDSVVVDPRVAEVSEVRVEPAPGLRDTVRVVVVVVPVDVTSPVTVGPFTLELSGGAAASGRGEPR